MNAPTELTVIDRAALALGTSETEKQIKALVEQSKTIVVITNKDGREECHSAAMRAVKVRTTLSKVGAAARADATAYSKAVIAEENRLLDLIEPEEKRLKALRDEWDEARKAEEMEKARIEGERQAAIEALLDGIRMAPVCVALCTADETEEALNIVLNMELNETNFAERLDEAIYVRKNIITQMESLLAGKRAQEQLAAQLEAQRIAQEQAAELQRKAEAEARHKAQQEAERQRQELAAQAELQKQEREELARDKEKQESEYREARRVLEENQRIEREKLAAQRAEIEAMQLQFAQLKAEAELAEQRRAAEEAERVAKAQAALVPSMCWKCNHSYPIGDEKCPACGATNPNVDFDKAVEEQNAGIAAEIQPVATTSPAPIANRHNRPARSEIVELVAVGFGVSHDVALEWLIVEFA